MKGYKSNIEELTTDNQTFRRVLYTGPHLQLVLMTLRPGEDIGEEVHKDTDQFFRFEAGRGQVTIDGTVYDIKGGDAVIVPAGATHNIVNTGSDNELSMYTIYAPSHHKEGTVHNTKAEALADQEHFDGNTTE